MIKDESGVTAIEYGLIAALIAVAPFTIMGTLGTNLSGTFSQAAAGLEGRSPAIPALDPTLGMTEPRGKPDDDGLVWPACHGGVRCHGDRIWSDCGADRYRPVDGCEFGQPLLESLHDLPVAANLRASAGPRYRLGPGHLRV